NHSRDTTKAPLSSSASVAPRPNPPPPAAPRHRLTHRRRPVQSEPVLDVSHVTVGFGDHLVLDGVDLQVHPGRATVLLGPNGAGKTTLIRSCTGLMEPTSGQVSLCGTTAAAACAEGRVGLMPQATGAWSGITAAELLGHLA